MEGSCSAPDLDTVIAVLSAYIAREHAAPPDEPDDITALISELERKRTLINCLEVDFARAAARFAARYDERTCIDPTPVSWMRANLHMTSHAAATAVHVGQQAAQLPRSCAALSEGRIGFAHLGLMASLAVALEQSPTASVPRMEERSLLRKAERLSVQSFRTACAHVRHAADRAGFLEEQLLDVGCRALTLRSMGGGCLELQGFFDAEGGALLRSALDPLARPSGADDQRSREQRYADALAELCLHGLDHGLIPQTASQRAHLQVTTTLETLRDLPRAAAGEMEFAGPVASATVQRLACDATITRVLVNAESAVIDVGRTQRVVPGSTRRALNVRDRGCRWPGCERPASWTQAHHLRHWANHGATDASNLVLLCRYHHWSVHEGGWRMQRLDDGAVRVVPPLRDTISAAPQLREHAHAGEIPHHHASRAREPALA